MLLKPVDFEKLRFPINLIARYLDKYKVNEIEDCEFEKLEIAGKKCIMVPDNPNVRDRMNSMEIIVRQDTIISDFH